MVVNIFILLLVKMGLFNVLGEVQRAPALFKLVTVIYLSTYCLQAMKKAKEIT